METVSRKIRGVLVVQPVGKFDPAILDGPADVIARHLEAGERWFLIDLARTTQIARPGMLYLLRLQAKLMDPSGAMVLSSVGPQIIKVFTVARLAGKFVIAGSIRGGIRRLVRAQSIKRLSDAAAALLERGESRDLELASQGGGVG